MACPARALTLPRPCTCSTLDSAMPVTTCTSCGANLGSSGAECPNCGDRAVSALLATALGELRSLPHDDVRTVLNTATAAFWRAASGVTEFSPVLPPTAGTALAEAATANDELDAEVFSPRAPATTRLLKELGRLATLKNLVKASGLAVLLVKGCNDILGKPTIINIGCGNVTVEQQVVAPASPSSEPSSGAKAPDNSPSAPEPDESPHRPHPFPNTTKT